VDGGLNSSLCTHASKASRSRHRVTTSTSSPASALNTSMEMNPGKLWTLPRLSRNFPTTRSAAPSFTETPLKIAITRGPGSTGDNDAAAADALGHL
jgi:hypothetical protein